MAGMEEKIVQSMVTLANASTIVCEVISRIAGNDISNTIKNSPINRSAISAIAMSRFAENLSK